MIKSITLGTRGSKLAIIQTEIVKNQLQTLFPHIQIETHIIRTTGDKNMNPVPLDTIGKDWFTKEIDKALLDGTIDAAVHSLKDLSEVLPEGLVIAAIPEREDAREAFISRTKKPFNKLKKGAVIGTDSTRRKSQLLFMRPDLQIKSLRGNVNRRLEKLESGEYDGIFLAVAGLKRLGLEKNITEYFSEKDIVPSPGQGALAVVVKKDNKELLQLVKKINNKEVFKAIKAERVFSKFFGGGCSMPMGAYAVLKNKKIELIGMVGSLDGKHVLKDSMIGDASSPKKVGKKLAEKMLQESSPWYDANNFLQKEKYVVITRPEKENKKFIKKLHTIGLQGYSYPTIIISKLRLSDFSKKYLYNIASFDWILFTSRNGVRFFVKALKDAKINPSVLQNVKIAAVGVKTVEEIEKNGLKTLFIPSEFTTKNITREFKNIKNKKILLPRADIATDLLPQFFETQGAEVVTLPVYQTTFFISPDKTIERLLFDKKVGYITFTSPSTIKGFLENMKSFNKSINFFQIPVLAIGPMTTKALRKYGFENIYTADTFTEEGMIMKLKEILV